MDFTVKKHSYFGAISKTCKGKYNMHFTNSYRFMHLTS